MSTKDRDRRRLELRFILLYFWAYWLQSVHAQFLNLSLRLRGFSGTSIGFLGSVAALTGVLVTPFVGVRFDRSNSRPRFLTGLALLCGAAFSLYRVMPNVATLVPVAILLAVGWLSLAPLLDSVALGRAVSGATRRGYGGYRRWGSIGFAVAGVAVGALVGDGEGINWIFPVYAALALLVAILAIGIPGRASAPGDRELKTAAFLELLALPNFRRFLLLTLLGSVGSAGCFAFRVIHLNAIGVPGAAIGALMVLPILAEVVCFTFASSLLTRFGTGHLILAGRLMGAARWWFLSVMKYSPWLFATEILHGTSYGVFQPAALRFIHSEVPARLRGTAQVLLFSTSMGLGSAIGAFLAGRMYDLAGMRALLLTCGAIVAISGVLQLTLVKHLPPEKLQDKAKDAANEGATAG